MNDLTAIVNKIKQLETEIERLKRVEYSRGTSAWKTFDDITITGWAAGGAAILEYLTVGDLVFCRLYVSGNSNGTTATVTLPYKAKTSGTTNHFRGAITEGRNGGSSLTTPGHWVIVSGGDVLTAYTAMPAGAWTASGVKSINISFWYAKE